MSPVPSAARLAAPLGIGAPRVRVTVLPTDVATAAPRAHLSADVETAGPGAVSAATTRPGTSEPAAPVEAVGEPCSCGHTIVLAAAEAALLLRLAHGLTTPAIARQLGLTEKQVSSGIKTLRTVFGVERIPHLVDSAIRWRMIAPDAVAPIRPGRPSRDLKVAELGALTRAAAGSSAEASAKTLGISTGRVHKALAAARDVLLARDTTHAITLGHRLRLLPGGHPHLATHSADLTAEEGAA